MKMINKFGGRFSRYQVKTINLLCLLLYLAVFSCQNGPKTTTITSTVDSSTIVDQRLAVSELPHLYASKNFSTLESSFTIKNDTVINIQAVGEGVDYSINKSLIKSYDNDCVEVYLDLLNNKLPTFDAIRDDRQYRIVWKLLRIDGINFDSRGVIVTETDPSKNNYTMNIAFPWTTLGYVKPVLNKQIGFDVAIDDNDGATRKGLFSWNSAIDEGWRNTSVYGTLILAESNLIKKEKYAISLNTKVGNGGAVPETFWTNCPKYHFKNVISGTITDEKDLSGFFQTAWDKDYLYLRVNVTDNIKNYAQVMFDYGWIEDKAGKPIWTMQMSQTVHAGGAVKNRYCDTTISIKKGTYRLKYVTDENHSPEKWDDVKPQKSFYGIKMSYSKKEKL